MKNLRVVVKLLWNNPRMRSPAFHLLLICVGFIFGGWGGFGIKIFLKCLGNLFSPTPIFEFG